MKQSALDYLRANLSTLYVNYYRENTNQWILNLFDYDPFEMFMEIPDFQLAPIPLEYNKKGELDIQNCKILYTKLMNISESQASDERLWAGLCHSVFYQYVCSRWNYSNLPLKDQEKDKGAILSRFFFSGGIRSGFFRNTLAKYWWIGKTVYQPKNNNRFELLDALGPDDFSSKVIDLFYSYTFSSNLTIISGVCKAWKIFRDNGIKLTVREYFRPALQHLNALGGVLLLDVLSEEEIKDIFFQYLQQLYKDRENIAFVTTEPDSEEDDDELNDVIDETIQQIREANSVTKKPAGTDNQHLDMIVIGTKNEEAIRDAARITKLKGVPNKVKYGCTVYLTNLDIGKKICCYIPSIDAPSSDWLPFQKLVLGKTKGYTFFLRSNYRIDSITW